MNAKHTVKAFDEDLIKLDNIIAEMGGLAEVQLADAIDALIKRNIEKAERVIANDARLDSMERQLDELSVRTIALRQPVADDLRSVIAALKTSAAIERIGDYAKNVAKRTVAISQAPPMGPTKTIARMGSLVQGMIKTVLDAYVARDADKAEDVRRRDLEVDAMHTSLFRELLTYMMEDARNISPCTHLLFVAKNIERIGDHATSIAENIIYRVRGGAPSNVRPKEDSSSFMLVDPGPNASAPEKSVP